MKIFFLLKAGNYQMVGWAELTSNSLEYGMDWRWLFGFFRATTRLFAVTSSVFGLFCCWMFPPVLPHVSFSWDHCWNLQQTHTYVHTRLNNSFIQTKCISSTRDMDTYELARNKHFILGV